MKIAILIGIFACVSLRVASPKPQFGFDNFGGGGIGFNQFGNQGFPVNNANIGPNSESFYPSVSDPSPPPIDNGNKGKGQNQGNNAKKNNRPRNQSRGKPKGNGHAAANPVTNTEYQHNPFLQEAIAENPSLTTTRAPARSNKKKNNNNGNRSHNSNNNNNKSNSNHRGNGSSKNKNKAKGKKRVSQAKFEQYTSSIFPDSEYDPTDIMDFNGRELAEPGEFPHMGAIGYRNTVLNRTVYKCGASLISELYVITSAHCTEFNGLQPSYVRFGDLNLSAGEENVDPQTRQISRIINHPAYRDDLLYNDIALIQLAKPVIFTEFVRPIRIWHHDEIPFTYAFAMGFGAIQFAGAATNRLTVFNLTIVPNNVCRNVLPMEPMAQQGIVDSQICAIDYRKKGSDTYQGDSGGPLQISFYGRRSGRLKNALIGITSFGVLGANRYPGVYTRVSYYIDWIEQNVWGSDYYN